MSVVGENERLANHAIFEHNDPTIYELFHENTKLNSYELKKLQHSLAMAVSNSDFKKASLNSGKCYPTLPRKNLLPKKKLSVAIDKVIWNRRSIREFLPENISFQSLSTLLQYSSGISHTIVENNNGSQSGFRTYPSGGGLYPLEIYLVVNRVSDLQMGLYHYNVRENCLEKLLTKEELYSQLDKLHIRDQLIKESGVTILLTSVFKRSTYKYGDRGYRFVLMEVGHLSQNIALVSEALNLGSCNIGGYEDDELNTLLQIDGVSEAVVGEIAIGIPDLLGKNLMPDAIRE